MAFFGRDDVSNPNLSASFTQKQLKNSRRNANNILEEPNPYEKGLKASEGENVTTTELREVVKDINNNLNVEDFKTGDTIQRGHIAMECPAYRAEVNQEEEVTPQAPNVEKEVAAEAERTTSEDEVDDSDELGSRGNQEAQKKPEYGVQGKERVEDQGSGAPTPQPRTEVSQDP
ncbi:hypothetical protein R1sor_014763 [Riccia sorocarpa]|uniref:Uncharacterized protein n=1 Tax=Riccia sorocarpa TaxID=122646 RepID=A0ABD3HD67_9MARC